MYFAYLRIEWKKTKEILKVMEQEACLEGASSFEELLLERGVV